MELGRKWFVKGEKSHKKGQCECVVFDLVVCISTSLKCRNDLNFDILEIRRCPYWENALTLNGLEPLTSPLLAERANHLRHRVCVPTQLPYGSVVLILQIPFLY